MYVLHATVYGLKSRFEFVGKRTTIRNLPTVQSVKYIYINATNNATPYVTNSAEPGENFIFVTHVIHLIKDDLPTECNANGLELFSVPDELAKLNSLERHLIARRIPFMKILTLPKGGQKGVKGPVICVPSNIQNTRDTLPRPIHDSALVTVALKRKLEYKNYYEKQIVDLTLLEKGLNVLKQINHLYKDIQINTDRGEVDGDDLLYFADAPLSRCNESVG